MQGWLKGTQTHLDFISERTTDFIFAVFAEFGLISNVLLLVLYLLVIGRRLYIASKASNTFSRLMAGAIALSFFTYAFVNIGMVSGILPVVGNAAATDQLRRYGAGHLLLSSVS